MTNPGEDARVESDLTNVYRTVVPDLPLDPTPAPVETPWQRRLAEQLARYRRPALVALSATAILAAVLIAPSFWDSETQPVSAAEVLERATASAQSALPAGGTLSYHMVSTAGKPGTSAEFTTETWYSGAGRFRIEDTAPDGFLFGQIVDGEDVWMYQTFDGIARAAHGPSSALGKGFSGEFLEGQQSLADVLSQYRGSCQSPNQIGEDMFLNRAVYVIQVTTDADSCASDEESIKTRALEGSSLMLWVDRETFLTLKTEHRDVDGTVSFRQVATEFTVASDLPDSTFFYEPPEGVTVVEVADLGEAKQAIIPLEPKPVSGGEGCVPAKEESEPPVANDC